jgi:hypothetical protein
MVCVLYSCDFIRGALHPFSGSLYVHVAECMEIQLKLCDPAEQPRHPTAHGDVDKAEYVEAPTCCMALVALLGYGS